MASHLLRMRKALGSNPSVSMSYGGARVAQANDLWACDLSAQLALAPCSARLSSRLLCAVRRRAPSPRCGLHGLLGAQGCLIGCCVSLPLPVVSACGRGVCSGAPGGGVPLPTPAFCACPCDHQCTRHAVTCPGRWRHTASPSVMFLLGRCKEVMFMGHMV